MGKHLICGIPKPAIACVAALSLFGCFADPDPRGVGPATAATSRGAGSVSQLRNLPFEPLPATLDLTDPRIFLGRTLFHDQRLSRDNSIACASCHDIGAGGVDGRPTALGIDGAVGPINTPTVLNAANNFVQFWDGRAATLEEQIPGPVHNPIEMGSNWAEVLEKLDTDTALRAQFDAIYPDGVTASNVIDAIASYERALLTGNSKFDDYLRGNENAFSEQEKAGYGLFVDLGCASCHQGKNVGGNMFQHFGVMGDYFQDRGNVTEADLGRYNVTGRERDKFVFRVPSLRNVALTAPYFHDGSKATLDGAVRIMAEYQLGRPIADDEVEALVSFLHTLTGGIDEQLL